MLPSAHIIEALLGPGAGHFSGGQVAGRQAQTDGELSKRLVVVQATF